MGCYYAGRRWRRRGSSERDEQTCTYMWFLRKHELLFHIPVVMYVCIRYKWFFYSHFISWMNFSKKGISYWFSSLPLTFVYPYYLYIQGSFENPPEWLTGRGIEKSEQSSRMTTCHLSICIYSVKQGGTDRVAMEISIYTSYRKGMLQFSKLFRTTMNSKRSSSLYKCIQRPLLRMPPSVCPFRVASVRK